MGKIDDYIAYMMELVTNPKHGYDQINRWGPDYDCSSSIITAVQTVIPVKDAGATYTGNMKKAFEKCGFISIPCKNGLPTLCRGDILLNEKHHAAMFIGGGKVAQFSINEKGKTTGGKSGDQTGKESGIFPLYTYSKGWDYVLRLQETEEQTVEITMTVLNPGAQGAEVTLLQVLLNELGFKGRNSKPLTVDGWYKPRGNTEFALELAQKSFGLTADKICGKKTWTCLLHARYS